MCKSIKEIDNKNPTIKMERKGIMDFLFVAIAYKDSDVYLTNNSILKSKNTNLNNQKSFSFYTYLDILNTKILANINKIDYKYNSEPTIKILNNYFYNFIQNNYRDTKKIKEQIGKKERSLALFKKYKKQIVY